MRGLLHFMRAVLMALSSPVRIQDRIRSGETRSTFASSRGVKPRCSASASVTGRLPLPAMKTHLYAQARQLVLGFGGPAKIILLPGCVEHTKPVDAGIADFGISFSDWHAGILPSKDPGKVMKG